MTRIPSLTILLTRKNGLDDSINVKPHLDKDGVFNVQYKDKHAELVWQFEDTWDEVMAYLAQVFAILPLDREPYDYVQFCLPAYPTICIRPSETTCPCIMEPIWSCIESVGRGWPTLRDFPRQQ